jgi:hypothetical protein
VEKVKGSENFLKEHKKKRYGGLEIIENYIDGSYKLICPLKKNISISNAKCRLEWCKGLRYWTLEQPSLE